MSITLPREQQEWLETQVKAGVYASIDDAVASIVAEHMQIDLDDLSWAKPLVDEARASVDRGEGMTLDDYRARMTERFSKLTEGRTIVVLDNLSS
jgi:antitoxin ParD1/3/4